MIDGFLVAAIVTCSSAFILLLLFLIVVGFVGMCTYEKGVELVSNAFSTVTGLVKWMV